jgi:hypothetical protein
MSIIFILSGHARSFPFNSDINRRSNDILKSYNENLFTEEFKATYNYKIYITTDDLDVKDTIDYFTPEKIGNIHLLNTNFYLKPITQQIPDLDFFLEKYRKIDFKDNMIYENGIHQYYKLLDCYNLFINDGIKPLYIIRLRPDMRIDMNIMDVLKLFDTEPNTQIICEWERMNIGKPDIMNHYCANLVNNFGNYTYNTPVPDSVPIWYEVYHTIDKIRWTYAPERQFLELLFDYCNNNNLDMHESIKSRSLCTTIR